jgi:hypothetical protein
MAGKSYRLKVSADGREFEAEGDKKFVLEMVGRFGPDVGEAAPQRKTPSIKGPSKKESSGAVLGKTLSIREFVQQLGLKKHTDIALAFGYYLEKYRGTAEFTPADVNSCYYEAKLESSNTSQAFIQNIKRGFLMPSKKKGEKGKSRYTITSSGEKFIESKLTRGE